MWKQKKIIGLLGAGIMMLPQLALGKTLATVNVNVLNVRSEPTTTSAVVKKVYAKEVVQVVDLVGTSDRWYEVNVQGTKAYIKQDYLTLTKADGRVKATKLNIRSYPDMQKSKVIGSLKNGTEVEILYQVNGFYKIMVNGNTGFVASEYIGCSYAPYISKQQLSSVGEITTWIGEVGQSSQSNGSSQSNESSQPNGSSQSNESSQPNESSQSNGSSQSNEPSDSVVATNITGDNIVESAMKYLGNPYVYGGTSLTNGADCSGFTQSVMKLHGVTIPRTSLSQSKVGSLIEKENVQKGDLLFFGSTSETISHCGIYIGDGKMIHASTPKTGIIISDAYTSGNLPLQIIRRVI